MSEKKDYLKIEKDTKIRTKVLKILTYIMLSVWGIIVLFPFYYMILTSLKSSAQYNAEYVPKLFK